MEVFPMKAVDVQRLFASHEDPSRAEVDDAVFVGTRRRGRWHSIHTELVQRVGRETITTTGGVYARSDRGLIRGGWPEVGERKLLSCREAEAAISCIATRLPFSAEELCSLAHQVSLPSVAGSSELEA
jgi:hypothetical protein